MQLNGIGVGNFNVFRGKWNILIQGILIKKETIFLFVG